MRSKIFVKYLVAGGIAFGVDVIAFMVFRFIGLPLTAANPMARLAGALAAFSLNRLWTFKRISPGPWSRELFRYGMLWCFSTLCSTVAIAALVYAFPEESELIFKVFVECLVVAMNYVVSRIWVFQPGKGRNQILSRDS